MAIVNEIITKFGFQGSVAPLHNYNNALGDSINLLATAAAGIIATAGAMGAFILSTTKAVDPLIQLSRATGVQVEALQELSFAASVSGSSVEALQSSIGALSDKIGEAAQQGSEDFARLGISVRDATGQVKTADRVLEELRGRFNDLNLSIQERRTFAQRLGIDASLVQLLSRTSEEMAELRARAKALGTLNADQADAAVRLNDAYTTLRFGLDGLRNSVAVGLAPRMEELAGIFVDFLETNRDVIADGLSRMIEVIQALAESIIRLLPTIGLMAAAFTVWKVASVGLGVVLGTIFSPVVIVSAALVGLLLVVDDLIVALDGGRSVIADFFQEFFGIDIVTPLRAAVDTVGEFFSALLDTGKGFIAGLQDAFSGFIALMHGDLDLAAEFFGATFDRIVGFGSAAFDQLISLFSTLGAKLTQELTDLGPLVMRGLSGLADGAAEVGGQIVDALTAPIRQGFDALIDWIKGKLATVSNVAGSVASFFGFGDDDGQVEQPADQTMARRASLTTDLQERRTGGFGQVEQPADQTMARRASLTTDLQERRTGGFGQVEQPADQLLFRRVHLLNIVSEEAKGAIQEASSLLDTLRMPQEIQVSVNVTGLDESLSGAAVELTGRQEMGAQQMLTPQPNNVDNRTSQTTIEQRNDFRIVSDSPRETGDAVADSLSRQLRDARIQFGVGGF